MNTVLDIKKQLQDLTGYDYTETSVSDRFMRFINNTRLELSKQNDWDFLKKTFYLKTVADETTGTVSVTNGSYTVTGSGTSFTNIGTGRIVGWYLALGGVFYKVNYVTSDVSLTIEAPYTGSNLSGSDFTLRKIFYRVPADARKIKEMYQYTTPAAIERSDSDFIATRPDFQSITGTQAQYDICGLYGQNEALATSVAGGTYSTHSSIFTDTGATFLSNNIVPGDYLYDNTDVTNYFISNVNSETELCLYNKFSSSSNTVGGYTVYSNPDSMLVRFYPATAGNAIIPFEYYHYSTPLYYNWESDEFIRRYPELVVEGALVWEKRASDDGSWQVDYQKWRSSVDETIGSMKNPAVIVRNMFRYYPY